MATEKVSATLERETLTAVRARVGPRGVSAYLDAAVREKLDRDTRRARILAYLDELEEVDPTTDDEWDEADRRLARLLDQ